MSTVDGGDRKLSRSFIGCRKVRAEQTLLLVSLRPTAKRVRPRVLGKFDSRAPPADRSHVSKISTGVFLDRRDFSDVVRPIPPVPTAPISPPFLHRVCC